MTLQQIAAAGTPLSGLHLSDALHFPIARGLQCTPGRNVQFAKCISRTLWHKNISAQLVTMVTPIFLQTSAVCKILGS